MICTGQDAGATWAIAWLVAIGGFAAILYGATLKGDSVWVAGLIAMILGALYGLARCPLVRATVIDREESRVAGAGKAFLQQIE